MRRWLFVLLFVLALPVAPVALGQGAYPSRSDTFLNDYAKLLTETDAAAVQAMLSDLQAAHGIEAVVVTIDSISDYDTSNTTIEAFATGLFNTWGIGDATKNNGVLLLVAVKDRKVRVELGSGYGSGPSQEMQAVIDRYVLPKFRNSDYSGGIRLGTQALIAKLTDQPMPETGDIPAASAPSASTNYGAPSNRTTDSSVWLPFVLLLGAMLGFYVIGKAFRGESSYDGDDDDNRRSSSWSSSSHSSSSYSSSSSRSSSSHSNSNSRSGGGKSSGGGASGSW